MRVRAVEVGYDNIKVREIGEEFDMPKGAKAPWFVEVKKGESAPPEDGSDLA